MYYNRKGYGLTPRTIGGMIEDIFQNGWNSISEEASVFKAPVNIQENEKGYDLHVYAPGLKKEDLKIAMDRNVLTISYDHNEENKEQQEGKWLRNEYRHRSFKRSFTLNDKIDSSKISARYADGVLYVTLPKKEVAEQPQHVINVE
jgi:HSP20 family protein